MTCGACVSRRSLRVSPSDRLESHRRRPETRPFLTTRGGNKGSGFRNWVNHGRSKHTDRTRKPRLANPLSRNARRLEWVVHGSNRDPGSTESERRRLRGPMREQRMGELDSGTGSSSKTQTGTGSVAFSSLRPTL